MNVGFFVLLTILNAVATIMLTDTLEEYIGIYIFAQVFLMALAEFIDTINTHARKTCQKLEEVSQASSQGIYKEERSKDNQRTSW